MFSKVEFASVPIGARIHRVQHGSGWLTMRHTKVADDLAIIDDSWHFDTGTYIHMRPDQVVQIYTPAFALALARRKRKNS